MIRRKRTIGVDIDGVVCELLPSLLERVNKKYGSRLKKTDITDWNFKRGTVDLYKEILESLTDDNFVLNLPTVHGAREAIEKLSKHYHIIFVTARKVAPEKSTKEWIKKNFGGHYTVIFNGKKEDVKMDMLIDDNWGNANAFVQKTGAYALLFDQPVNRYMPHVHGIERCYDWEDVLRTVKRIFGD